MTHHFRADGEILVLNVHRLDREPCPVIIQLWDAQRRRKGWQWIGGLTKFPLSMPHQPCFTSCVAAPPLPCTLVSHSGLLLRPVPLGSGERRFPAGLSASGCLLCSLSEPFRLGGSWNAWRRRLGVSMLWQSFGLTGLDWRYFLRHSHLSTWTQ